MESYQILYNHTKAFEFKLISFLLEGSEFPIWIIVIVCSTAVAGIGTLLYLIRRSKVRSRPKSKVDKMLKKLK